MRIARIRHLFFPDMPRDYFYELSEQQKKRGNEVHVVTWNKNGRQSEILSDNFYIHRLNGVNFALKGKVQDYPCLPTLSSTLKQINPDIIHAESHLFLPSVQSLRIAEKLACPFIISVHGVYADRGLAVNYAQKTYLRAISRVFRKANRIICLTYDEAAEISKFGFPAEKISIIPNGVDTGLFKPSAQRESNLIVWAGRFVPEKGLEYLIEAAKIIHEKNNEAKLLLIGYGPLKSKLRLMVKSYDLEGFVIISDSLPRERIASILGKATVFVFPSIKEGLPVSVLEAAASAAPIVASDIPGVNCIIDNHKSGLLVPAKNSRALASAILDLLDNLSLRKELGSNARQAAIDRFGWQNVLDSLDSVYLQAVNEKNGNI